MDNDDSIWRLIILFFCLIFSALFSVSETALTSISKIRLRNMREEHVKGAEEIASLLETPEKVLSTLLVGNNIMNVFASVLVASIAMAHFKAEAAVGVATGVAAFMILVFSEITPKSIALKNPEKISLMLVKPLMLVMVVLSPIVFILEKITSLLLKIFGVNKGDSAPTITEQELITMVSVGHEEGVLKVEEKEMLHNVFEFGDGHIREIMTPRVLVISISDDDDYETVINTFKEHTYSRMPVSHSESDEIIGVLHIKDIAFANINKAEFAVRNYVRAPHFTYEFNNISKIFSEMRKSSVAMSIVLDEYGVMAGIVTTEDFIEEIVGDITDEYDDDEDSPKEVGENEYLVEGTIGIDNFNDVIGAKIESDDFESIGGFVLGKLEDLPEVGDKIVHENIEFTVESITNNRIESLRVIIQPGDPNNREGEDAEPGNNNGDVPNE